MKAYICMFMLCVAIVTASYINKDEPVKRWNEARIQNIEAATNELIAASERQARQIEAASNAVLEWNALFMTLYTE